MDNNNIDHIPILSYKPKFVNDFWDKVAKTLENKPTFEDEELEKIMEIMKVPEERLKK